jgi:hypothetical protein
MTRGRRPRGGTILVLAIVVLGGAAVGAAATGRFPLLQRTWGTVASVVSSAVAAPSSSSSSAPLADDAADAGTEASAMPHRQTAPLSSAQLGAPLVHGTFVTECGAPENMKVVVKADVRLGRALNVTVKTDPPNLAVSSCIERATRDLQWDVSPKTGHVTVRY